MEYKVTKIDEQGEQTTFFYENDYGKLTNLINCILQDAFKMQNWWTDQYKRKASEICSQISDSKHFHIWCHPTKNVSYLTRINA